ncbi:unnamed protein product [Echinostoma caproni]|uniref:MitMem_reg domain-containing protein n=1 Tax=Echinostoma caproni TaxID=27848 RepID=A0A183AXE9_9TREM|nr:unnamed protein product [Echinostoma caproni]
MLWIRCGKGRELGTEEDTEELNKGWDIWAVAHLPLPTPLDAFGSAVLIILRDDRCIMELFCVCVCIGEVVSNLELGDDMVHLFQLSEHLLTMLEQVIDYVNDVLNNKRPADPNIGRAIAQLVFSIPKLNPAHLESLINSSYKDLLMITYLTNLIRTHLKLLNLSL